ncbi:sensor histidine kinase [Flavobacterium sp.]|uniref:tetratricopeptide repeat-containing sensor histidine kinase n=1 Tax=Flavobacterium sp. TaxID=239 RepID=UPI002606B590|nr:sensor histidine kinase [Flavobacterium sp.]
MQRFLVPRRLLWLFFILHGFLFSVTAQQLLPVNEKTYADSLHQIVYSRSVDSIKANASFLLSDYWRAKDTVKSRMFLTKGKQLAAKNSYLNALYFFYEGQHLSAINPEKAQLSLRKATQKLTAFRTAASYETAAAAWYNYAILQRNKKGDSFVIDILLNKSIPLAQQSGKSEKMAHYYSQLGTLFMYNAQFDKAEAYNKKAIGLLEKNKPGSSELMLAYLGAVSNFIYKGDNETAKIMLDKAKVILEPHKESTQYPYYYYNEGLYLISKGYFNNAIKSLDKGIVLAQSLNQSTLLQMLTFRKYDIYLQLEEYKNARDLLLKLLKEGNLATEVNNRKMFYTQLASVNEKMGNLKEAYQWQTKYSQLSDSINNSKLKEKINELEVQFQNAENQKKITALETDKKEADLAARNNRLFSSLLGASALFFLAIAVLAFAFYRNQKKLSEQKEINHQQQLKELHQQQLLSTTEAMLEGEERERRRVARDLHDGLGGMLAGIKIKLSGEMSDTKKNPNPVEIQKIIGQLDNAVTELRRIARNMMPETLLRFGLETALKDLCESLESQDSSISYESFNIDPEMEIATQVIIYRIIQEALSNAIRHANAGNIMVQCSQNEKTFFITVEDDGTGFDKSILEQKKGIGVTNIQNRAKYLNGTVELHSAPGEGTTINIELHV